MKKLLLLLVFVLINSASATNTTDQFGGFGIAIISVKEGVKVMSVIDNSPALNSNILAGDIITAIDGQSLANNDINTSKKMLRGEVGSIANLNITRNNQELNLRLNRANFIIKAFDSQAVINYYDINSQESKSLSANEIKAVGDAQISAEYVASDVLLNGRSIKDKNQLSLNKNQSFANVYISEAPKSQSHQLKRNLQVNDEGFKITLNQSGQTDLNILNAKGKVVKAIDLGHQEAGTIEKSWDTSNLTKGYYLVKIKQSSNVYTQELTKK